MNDFRLDNEPKIKSGFQIPENYFETFSEKVMLQLPEQEPKVISIFQRRRTWIMAVAAVLVIALSIPIYNNLSTGSTEVDVVTLENYITEQSTINQYDLISVLEADDIENIKIDSNLEDKTIEDILTSNSNLEQIITE
jgi:hypothetical protein